MNLHIFYSTTQHYALILSQWNSVKNILYLLSCHFHPLLIIPFVTICFAHFLFRF